MKKEKEKRPFKKRLIIILGVAVVVGLLYYFLGLKLINKELAKYDLGPLENQLVAENERSKKIEAMKKTIEKSEGMLTGELYTYDNQSNEIIEMGRIFDEDAYNVSLVWSKPILSEDQIVRRDVNITFSCQSYENFKNVLKKMSEMKYRCLIKNITAADSEKNNKLGLYYSNQINASIAVTFFETAEGAENLAGLEIPKVDTDLSDTELAQRAHAYDDK